MALQASQDWACQLHDLHLTASCPRAASRVCQLTGAKANNGFTGAWVCIPASLSLLAGQTQRAQLRGVPAPAVTFSHKRNKKLQEVNLQYKRVYWPEEQRWVRLRISARVRPALLRSLLVEYGNGPINVRIWCGSCVYGESFGCQRWPWRPGGARRFVQGHITIGITPFKPCFSSGMFSVPQQAAGSVAANRHAEVCTCPPAKSTTSRC